MVMKFAAFAKPNEGEKGLFCIMMEIPKSAGMSQKDMENAINKQAQEKGGRSEMRLESSEDSTAMIAGKETKVTRMLMGSADGKQKALMYQLMIDKGGSLVMIQVHGPQEGFDQAAYDSFISSMK